MSTRPRHAALMDGVYRRQRHIYDATRKYFLFGRDRLIAELAPEPGANVLEIGCGTGRNLVLAARRYPQARFAGLDISAVMLESAREKIARAGLAERVTLAEADATRFDAPALFARRGFDRVFFSYTLSMVPDWRAALTAALDATAPEGRVHIVDFGQQEELPRPAGAGLRGWLSLFHVSPKPDMPDAVARAAAAAGRPHSFTPLWRGYAWAFTIGAARGAG